jgi:hypothetical protein
MAVPLRRARGVNVSPGRTPLAFAAREVGLIAGAIVAYFGIRNVTAGSPETAFANADELVRLEERLGTAWEDAVQGLAVDHDWFVMLTNWVYIWGHWPVILGAAVALLVLKRDHYYLLRNAMFISGALGFLFFAFFPVVPPRLLDIGLIDTVTDQSHAYRALQPPGLTNQYAAFPSLHAGWNVLVGIVVFGATTNVVVRALCVVGPASMCFAVVATANHFVVDVPAGIVVVVVGYAAARSLPARAGATLPAGERDTRRAGAAPVPDRAPRRKPSRTTARVGADRCRHRRSRRPALPRAARSPASQDRRAAAAPLGSLGARRSLGSAPPARIPARGDRARH